MKCGACPFYNDQCPRATYNHAVTVLEPDGSITEVSPVTCFLPGEEDQACAPGMEAMRLQRVEKAAKWIIENCPHTPKNKLCVICECAKQILRGYCGE